MQTKSNIQVIVELLEAKSKFFNGLAQIMEQYRIKDNVFCCGVNGVVEEPDHGYFGQVKEYANLSEAMEDFNILSQGVRIQGDKVFVGNLYNELAAVEESVFIDLEKSTVINN